MIKIDKETLEKWKISPNCVWNLYCIENKLDFTKDSLEVICNKQDKLIIINNDTNVINITKKGLDILKDFMVISGSKEDKVVLEKDLLDFCNKYRDLFPSGILSGNRPIKGDKQGVYKKLKKFISENKEYTFDVILEVTKKYINKCKQNNYKYISCADYFIEKNNSSLLSSMCEEYLESKSKGINKSFTGLTENGNDVI